MHTYLGDRGEMMKKGAVFLFILLLIPVLLISCSAKTTASPTPDPNLIRTAANQTADARLTEFFASTPSATPITPSPTFDAAQTIAAQTADAQLTQLASITPSPQGTSIPTNIPTGTAGDRAIFVEDVTIPDGKVISPGAAFTKTWKLQNGGTTTWTTSYSLAFVSGVQMGSTTSVPLSQSVPPGAQIDISVDLVAPIDSGSYQGYWKMQNASGSSFDDVVYVLITVGNAGATPAPTSETPGVTPNPTSTGAPGNPISSLTMSVDQGSFEGSCPHTFIFTAMLTLNQSTTLTYELEAESQTPGFVFDLPGTQTRDFDAGTYSIPSELTFTSSGTGTIWLHVSSPVDVSSNHEAFNLTCTP
jgi:hypothetical protein